MINVGDKAIQNTALFPLRRAHRSAGEHDKLIPSVDKCLKHHLDYDHPFGSDVLGRDVLSRVIYGLRVSLLVSVSAVAASLAVAAPLGLAAGYFGRWVDTAVSRSLDMILIFPAMLLAVTFIAILGPGGLIAAIAIAVIYLPILARVMRASTLVVSQHEYVAGARARGASHLRVLATHVAPNALGPVIIGRDCVIADSYIGPFTSVSENCRTERSEIEFSIVLRDSSITGVRRIEASLIGRNVVVTPAPAVPAAHRLVLGDHSKVQISS